MFIGADNAYSARARGQLHYGRFQDIPHICTVNISLVNKMKGLAEKFLSMSQDERKAVLINLCDRALHVWQSHYPVGGLPTYQESVTGSTQILDVALPHEALDAARTETDGESIGQRYKEPIVALQDSDLELAPDAAEFAYYSIYNAFRRYGQGLSIDEKLILNQALSALPNEEMRDVFAAALKTVG